MSEATPSVNKAPGLASASSRSRRLLGFGIFIAVVLIGAIFAFAYHNLSETRKGMKEDMVHRQRTVVGSRAKITNAWLESLVEQSRRLVGSDLFQLFAFEVDRSRAACRYCSRRMGMKIRMSALPAKRGNCCPNCR